MWQGRVWWTEGENVFSKKGNFVFKFLERLTSFSSLNVMFFLMGTIYYLIARKKNLNFINKSFLVLFSVKINFL